MRHCPKCGSEYADAILFCPNDGSATKLRDGGERDSFIGVTVDSRYRIDARIGEGGMGVVYRATHLVLKKLFAIKVMRGEQAHDPDVVQRFLQEARASSAIGHPNIVNISDFGTTENGAVYFAMEFLQGQTLGQAMDPGPLERGRALDIFVQIAGALEAAHEAGIVHRDLKPENIFLKREPDNPDFVKVLDFGIAKVKNAAAKITRTGMVFGTPHYMSPEQAAGQPVDHRSDIYSLGVIMYQVFTGQLPFDGDSFMDVLTKHMYEPAPPPNRPDLELPAALEAILMRALQKKPEQRQQSMRELRDALQNVRLGQPAISPLPSSMRVSPEPAPNVPAARVVVAEPVLTTPRAALPNSATLAAAALGAVVDNDDEPIAVPKRSRALWLWLLIAGVVLGLGALSLRGGSHAGTDKDALDASVGPEPSPLAAAGSLAAPAAVAPAVEPHALQSPAAVAPAVEPHAPQSPAPELEAAPREPARRATKPKPVQPAAPRRQTGHTERVDPWR